MRLLILAISSFIALCTYAQGSIVSAAENTHSSHNVVNWSLGGVFSGSIKTKKFIITQGFPSHVYQIIYDNKPGRLNIKCYPNPIETDFILELLSNEPQQYRWIITNTDGNKIIGEDVKTNLIHIDISQLQSSMYLLSIFDAKGRIVANAKLLKK